MALQNYGIRNFDNLALHAVLLAEYISHAHGFATSPHKSAKENLFMNIV